MDAPLGFGGRHALHPVAAGFELELGEGAGEFGRTVSFRVIDKALP